MRCLLFLLLAFISLADASDPSSFSPEELTPVASEYARAAGLAPLTSTAGFELRIWTRDYMSGAVTGFIVANGTQRSFKSTSTYDQGKLLVKMANLGAAKPVHDLIRLKKFIDVLKAYNGQAVSCGVMDGESDLVDAVLQGHAITVKVDNPKFCSDKASKAVAHLLGALQH